MLETLNFCFKIFFASNKYNENIGEHHSCFTRIKQATIRVFVKLKALTLALPMAINPLAGISIFFIKNSLHFYNFFCYNFISLPVRSMNEISTQNL